PRAWRSSWSCSPWRSSRCCRGRGARSRSGSSSRSGPPPRSRSLSACARRSSITYRVAHRPTIRAANGLVASGHPLATSAGLAALRDGGSAVDAAIAAAAVSAVTLPSATSIGGDVFALVYDARRREVVAYNGSGAAPAAIDVERLRASGYPAHGAVMSTVPGCIGAWGDMMEAHGRLGLDRALAPAISYAEDGFPVTDHLSH